MEKRASSGWKNLEQGRPEQVAKEEATLSTQTCVDKCEAT